MSLASSIGVALPRSHRILSDFSLPCSLNLVAIWSTQNGMQVPQLCVRIDDHFFTWSVRPIGRTNPLPRELPLLDMAWPGPIWATLPRSHGIASDFLLSCSFNLAAIWSTKMGMRAPHVVWWDPQPSLTRSDGSSWSPRPLVSWIPLLAGHSESPHPRSTYLLHQSNLLDWFRMVPTATSCLCVRASSPMFSLPASWPLSVRDSKWERD